MTVFEMPGILRAACSTKRDCRRWLSPSEPKPIPPSLSPSLPLNQQPSPLPPLMPPLSPHTLRSICAASSASAACPPLSQRP